ncbi:uncharacterized protein LOC122243719 [Penaeus japonicus]|uniref:uncharacterized protein LOC122243719 n=1 Tax=Penaeus japonicus TaxID=27405 RepID=UPI001C715771|nr:uncharacterized protein LOC122243719 [Penaeus japonicus]
MVGPPVSECGALPMHTSSFITIRACGNSAGTQMVVFDPLNTALLLVVARYSGNLKLIIFLTAIHAGAFKALADLDTLDLYQNNIVQLPDNVFEGLVNLESLWVSHNLLTNIPDISFITKAKAISFSNNNIETFPRNLLDNPTFPLTFSLQNNLATEISASAIIALPDYSTLYLDAITIWAADAEQADALRAKLWFGVDVDDLIQIGSSAGCPSHFHEVQGVCVFVEPLFSSDWGTMKYFCHEIGADMLKIEDANFFHQLLRFLRSEGMCSVHTPNLSTK